MAKTFGFCRAVGSLSAVSYGMTDGGTRRKTTNYCEQREKHGSILRVDAYSDNASVGLSLKKSLSVWSLMDILMQGEDSYDSLKQQKP